MILKILFEHKKSKIGIILVAIMFLLILLYISLLSMRREKTISGYVLDCNTSNQIDGAEISVNQRGWGFARGSLVWDKDYVTTTESDISGHFAIKYKVGSSADLKGKKEGYLIAEQFEFSGDNVEIKMLKGEGTDITYHCKKSTECLSCSMEGTTEVCKNVCL